MSIYAALDGAIVDQPASGKGWSDLCRWIDGLEKGICPQLEHLHAYGWCQNLTGLERQLGYALDVYPPDDETVEETAKGLLGIVARRGTAEVLTITNGFAPADPAHAAHAEPLSVPDQRQDNGWQCGAAALQSALGFFGVHVGESDLAAELGTTREDGTSPDAIMDVCRQRGIHAQDQSGMNLGQLGVYIRQGYPVLVPIQAHGSNAAARMLESGHWVVVTGLAKAGVRVQDPSREGGGKRVIPRVEFVRNWRDQDADGVEYVRYGIVVRGPK